MSLYINFSIFYKIIFQSIFDDDKIIFNAISIIMLRQFFYTKVGFIKQTSLTQTDSLFKKLYLKLCAFFCSDALIMMMIVACVGGKMRFYLDLTFLEAWKNTQYVFHNESVVHLLCVAYKK